MIDEYVNKGLISKQKHPTEELYIYNYTNEVQYSKFWDEVTLNARGLILDGGGNVVAKPFPKFFNMEELKEIPNLPFEVYDKMDGSLGILYWIGDIPYIATRGSFISEQAIHASKLLQLKYKHIFPKLNKNHTYLFEIIYPENRIVVDYGDLDDLILLAILRKDGSEYLEDVGFPIVKKYDGISDFKILKNLNLKNKEGFVIRFSSGLRMKIKFEEYIRLHRIMTGVSNIDIWEYLKDGIPMRDILDRVPDEFYDWVKKIQEDLICKYEEIKEICKKDYKELNTKKETALYFQTCKYPAILFGMLNGKDISKIIWKLVRPKYSKPFSL